MSSTIKISIPAPCHEDWATMTQLEKGRFCGSCQKQVIDFTNASDREIAQSYRSEKKLCGRFLKSQLDRDLVIPNEKSTWWLAVSIAVISFLTLGTEKIMAHEPVKTEVLPEKTNDTIVLSHSVKKATITVIILDKEGMPIPNTHISNLSTEETYTTDFDGIALVDVNLGDEIMIEFKGFITQKIKINSLSEVKIILKEYQKTEHIIMGYMQVRKSK